MTRTVGNLSPREVCEVWRAGVSQRKKLLTPHLPVLLASFSASLQERERKVLELYAGQGLTLREIGVCLKGGSGISPSYVSKLFTRVCGKLCTQLSISRPDTVVALGFSDDVIVSLIERGVYTQGGLSDMTTKDILELVKPDEASVFTF